MLFSHQIAPFMQRQESVHFNSPGELAQKALCFKNHLIPFFGNMAFDSITTHVIEDYVASRRNLTRADGKRGLKNATINHHLLILRRYLSFAVGEGHCAAMPKFKMCKATRPNQKNFLSPAEARALYLAADRHCTPMWRHMMVVAANTGLRIGELLALDWRNVDFERRILTVSGSYCQTSCAIKSTKSGEVREIDLNASALAALRLHHRDLGEPTEGLVTGKATYQGARKAMQSTCKRAKFTRPVTWHTLRHTFASNLVQAGQPLFVVSKLLGHSSISMSERYTHLGAERRRLAVDALEGVL